MRSEHISVVVEQTPQAVYDYARDPVNLPRWAAGLAGSEVRVEGHRLIAEAPMGRVSVVFAPINDFGVLDHDVTLPDGSVVNNPFRVLAHPSGSEMLFTVRQFDSSDDDFAADCAVVAADLGRLKALLEN